MKTKEKQQLNNMKIMVKAFGEIAQIVMKEGNNHFEIMNKYSKIMTIVYDIENKIDLGEK